jgi:feruloyl esterase
VEKAFGPTRTDFFRSYFAPGLFHCTGGENNPTDFQDVLLSAAADWVETGKAPDYVIASNAPRAESGAGGTPTSGEAVGKATRTYKICAYPSHAMFIGGLANPNGLDVNDARNWRCVK